MEFTDISHEEWRKYTFKGGDTVYIMSPLKIYGDKEGDRILDAQGISHYVPRTFIHLEWRDWKINKEDSDDSTTTS